MKGLYKDKELKIKHGWFRYFYANQFVSSQGNYVNGKKDGLWVSYHYNGMMKDSIVYSDGFPGIIKAWHINGRVRDSSVYKKDGSAMHWYWFDNGQLSHTGSSYRGEQDGHWIFNHMNGKPAATELYKKDKLVSRVYYDEAGVALTDTTNRDTPAAFKGGKKKWRSFLFNDSDFMDGVKLVNTTIITVVLAFTIDEEGNVTDAYVEVPVSPAFDERALQIIKRSPAWNPAISHNRRIKTQVRQPISFTQLD